LSGGLNYKHSKLSNITDNPSSTLMQSITIVLSLSNVCVQKKQHISIIWLFTLCIIMYTLFLLYGYFGTNWSRTLDLHYKLISKSIIIWIGLGFSSINSELTEHRKWPIMLRLLANLCMQNISRMQVYCYFKHGVYVVYNITEIEKPAGIGQIWEKVVSNK